MTAKSSCPKCGRELIIEYCKEEHKVYNGIGMQTVAVDHWTEVVEMSCDHQPDMFTEDEWEDIEKEAVENWENSKEDYLAERYDQLKDEGRL